MWIWKLLLAAELDRSRWLVEQNFARKTIVSGCFDKSQRSRRFPETGLERLLQNRVQTSLINIENFESFSSWVKFTMCWIKINICTKLLQIFIIFFKYLWHRDKALDGMPSMAAGEVNRRIPGTISREDFFKPKKSPLLLSTEDEWWRSGISTEN